MLPLGLAGWAWHFLVEALKGRNDRGRGQISTPGSGSVSFQAWIF